MPQMAPQWWIILSMMTMLLWNISLNFIFFMKPLLMTKHIKNNMNYYLMNKKMLNLF